MANIKRFSRNNYLKVIAHLGVLLTMVAWGTSFISSKVLMVDGGFTPVETYIYRFTVAYIILLSFTFKRIFAYSWKDEFTVNVVWNVCRLNIFCDGKLCIKIYHNRKCVIIEFDITNIYIGINGFDI